MGNERETLYTGLSHGAWGYFFLTFDFNLGTVSVLPRFVGLGLLLSAIAKLSGERRDLKLLRPLCTLLMGWAAADWLLSWIGADLDGHILFLDLLISAAGLYFHYQFLSDMAALAEQYQPEGAGLDRKLRRRRTVYIVVLTAFDLAQDVPIKPAGRLGELGTILTMGGLLIGAVSAVLIMTALFGLRRCFREAEGAVGE